MIADKNTFVPTDKTDDSYDNTFTKLLIDNT